jgi:hypothetical protein
MKGYWKKWARPVLLAMLIFVSWAVILPSVHATNIVFDSKASQPGGTTNTNFQATITVTSAGDALLVNIYGVGVFNSFSVTDSEANTFTERVCSISGSWAGSSTYIFTTLAATSGSDTVTVATGGATRAFGFTVLDYSNVASFGVSATNQNDNTGNTGTSTVTLTGTQSSLSAIIEAVYFTGSGTQPTLTNDNGQITRDNINTGAPVCNGELCRSTDIAAPSTSFSLSFDYAGTSCPLGPCFISHSALELTGTSGGASITQVTNCYGNCGSPAITLANTNSTHNVAFNQSITLFYEFQPTINGFFLNATTNVARAYTNGQQVFLGLYLIPSCPLGSSPFSASCPGNLQGSTTFTNPNKGKIALTLSNSLSITAGQWAAVAVSCLFAPCDLNDTNTNANIFQTNGVMPAVIQQSSQLTSCACKTGLWAFVRGNVITNIPPVSAPGGSCAGLDCILPNVVNSFCNNVTPTCQTGSSLFWVFVLTIVSIATLSYILGETLPSVNLGRLGIGEMGILLFIGWLALFESFSLISAWVMILVFFIVSWLFLGRLKGTGPL